MLLLYLRCLPCLNVTYTTGVPSMIRILG